MSVRVRWPACAYVRVLVRVYVRLRCALCVCMRVRACLRAVIAECPECAHGVRRYAR